MFNEEQKKKLKEFLTEQIGKPYLFGAEALPGTPIVYWDCSELVEIAYAQIGIKVPDGARYQIAACYKLLGPVEREDLGDVGFLIDPPDTPARHVVMVYDDKNVIEARGKPFNKVMFCPKSYWENRKGFTGWYRFKTLRGCA